MTKDTSTETTVVSAGADTVNGQTVLIDLRQFVMNSRFNKKLSAVPQLLFHILVEQANRSHWIYPIEVSREELKEITHLKSNDTIDRGKQVLKSFGYIDYSGKPSKFTIYRPKVWNPNTQSYDSPYQPKDKTNPYSPTVP